MELGRTWCAPYKPLIRNILWAHSVRPYIRLSGLAPKERQSLSQGVPP